MFAAGSASNSFSATPALKIELIKDLACGCAPEIDFTGIRVLRARRKRNACFSLIALRTKKPLIDTLVAGHYDELQISDEVVL
jgi:hypothetical protein